MTHRIDAGHPQSGPPHSVDSLRREEIDALLNDLLQSDLSIAEFSEKLRAFPAITRRILMLANSAARAGHAEISESAHACAFLGSVRLAQLLEQLGQEVSRTDGAAA
ncbi:MAG: HDOD domain-containing protein [Planctomycetaceae bacterium]|nr:HDOD domain-containing protein [Planctomycetaceae bacterium]